MLQLFREPLLQAQFSADGSRLLANTYDAIEIHDTRSAVSAEAEALVGTLRERFPLWCDLREHLRESKLEPALRAEALKLVESRGESVAVVDSLVDSVLDQSTRAAQEYEVALRRAEGIAQATPWNGVALMRVGAALYRNSRPHEAALALERARALSAGTSARYQLFLAMSLARDGNGVRARVVLESARGAMGGQRPPQNLIAEAESVVAAAAARGK